jgi:hypothetical protein
LKIDAMVEREDFYKIAERTLVEYYLAVYNKNISIKVASPSIRSKILVYPKINAITTRFPGKKVIAYSYDEFNVRNNFWKFVLAKIYVTLCMFTGGLFAEKSIIFSDYSLFNGNILISPANRKIRIYDFENGVVDAIIKDSFTKRYFKNEMDFRLNYSYDFVLPIIKHGDNWYREEILPGQPLARIKNQRLYNKCIVETVSCMKKIAEDTLQLVDSKEYSINLFKDISKKLLVARGIKKIKYFDIITEIAQIALKKAQLLNAPLPVVESHGDLQSGNVWVDKKSEKTYIIDWETHEKRSIWYDCATILLSIRRANKLKEMAGNCNTDAIRKAVLENDTRKEYNMQAVMGIIILEDIMFYLDDMLELPSDFGGDIFDRITLEMDKMGWRDVSEYFI